MNLKTIPSINRLALLRIFFCSKRKYTCIVQHGVKNNLLSLSRNKFPKVNIRFSNVRNNEFSLKGVYPPITTPFNNDETIAYGRLEANLEKWNKIPFNGYVILGSTGESVSLTPEEKLKLVKVVVKNAPPNKHIIAGCGYQSTKSTIEMAEKMATVGANAVLVITPSFYKTRLNEDSFYLHYTKVADNSPIPVILYNVPSNTGVDLPASVIIRLASHPNIIGLKDSGGNVSKIGHVIFKTKNKEFKVLAGSAGFFYPALSIGCVGGVFALANPLGEALCHLYQLYKEGKFNEACNLQYRLIAPNMAVTAQYGIAGVKYAMDVFGYYGGPTRYPLQILSEDDKRILKCEFETNGFLSNIQH